MKLKNLVVKTAVLFCGFLLALGAEAATAVRVREFPDYLTNISSSPDLVFEGITLKELTDGTYLLGGCLSGDWEPERPASFSTRVLPEFADNATEMEVQFQYKSYADHEPIIKWVDVVFTQDGNQIKAYQKKQGYVRDRAAFGTKITTGEKSWMSGSQTTYRITRLGAGIRYSGVSGNVSWTALPTGVIDEDIILLHEDDTLTVSGFKFQNPVIGAGKIVVDRVPGGALKNSTSWHEWTGTLTLKGINLGLFDPGDYGHMGSKVEVVNCTGYFPKTGEGGTELVVTEKMTVNAGYTGQSYTIAKLSGDGTLDVTTTLATVTFTDSDDFTGSITGTGAGNIHRDTKAILVVNEGETVDIKNSVDKVLAIYGNGGTITSSANIWADKNAITSLILQHDSTIGGEYALGLSATSKGATTADLAGYTLTVDKKHNFHLCNATISNGGTIDVVKGNLLAWGAASTMSAGTLKLSKDASMELAVDLTVQDVINAGATFKTQDVDRNLLNGKLVVNGTLSGGGTIPKLTMGNGATIKLSGSEKLTVGTEFSCGTSLTIDLSDYLALDQAPIVLPTAMTQEQMAKLTVIPPTIRPNASLVVNGTSLALAYDPMTLYWAAWRGTFWEHIGQTDVNGNHGLMRGEAGNLTIAHRPNDTVVFDRTHYTVDGDYLSTAYWHYDENLYIKDEVVPGTSNDWDLKVLQGVTLKMGLRGARATGQNVISNLKIYVEEDSTLELGYWGNTHHYQGVIRDDVVFGGAGTIALGADMGPSCRVEGNIRTKGDVTPTLDVMGKELVVQGGQIDINLTGFGKLSGSGTITTPIAFNNAEIDATGTPGFTFKNTTSFTGTLTVDMASAPTGEQVVKICTKDEGGSFAYAEGIDVIVRVNGNVEPAFYTLATDGDGNLCVKVAPVRIDYDKDVVLGYDYKTMIARVTMTPAIEGVTANVTVKNVASGLTSWSGPVVGMRGSGRAEVMIGNEDDNFAPGIYTMTVTIGDWSQDVAFTVGDTWFSADATSGASHVTGGAWTTLPTVSGNAYQLSGEAAFTVSADKAAGEVGVIEQVVTFTSAADAEALAEAAASGALDGAKGAVTLAEVGAVTAPRGEGAAGTSAAGEYCWAGLVGGSWVELSGVEATLGTHTIRVEYDRTESTAKMRYLVDGAAVSEWFAVEGGDSAPAIGSVSYVGNGALSHLAGFVDDPALVEYAGVKYKSMEAAVAAWKAAGKAAGKSGVITLLTNIFFAPEPGTYAIDKHGFKLYLTNDMIIEREEGTTVVVGHPPVVNHYTTGLKVTIGGEEMDAPFIIDGEWLGHAIPWKRHSLIQTALTEKPENADFTRWQAYALGFAANEVETAKAPSVFAAESTDPKTVTLDDGLTPLPARETGVVVTRKLVGGTDPGASVELLLGEAAAEAARGTGLGDAAGETHRGTYEYDAEGRPEFYLTTMEGNVQYLKISYEFSGDAGQE